VHVAGAVRRPGLLRVPGGARVAAAIARAGGPARGADLTAVNLAQPLEDGQQVVVPRRGGAGGSAGTATATTGRDAGGAATGASMPSLATATLEDLDALDGIGPTLARRIVEYRQANGGFRSLEELREVDGIGEKRFAALREALRP
jgi:competence protein ComEA